MIVDLPWTPGPDMNAVLLVAMGDRMEAGIFSITTFDLGAGCPMVSTVGDFASRTGDRDVEEKAVSVFIGSGMCRAGRGEDLKLEGPRLTCLDNVVEELRDSRFEARGDVLTGLPESWPLSTVSSDTRPAGISPNMRLSFLVFLRSLAFSSMLRSLVVGGGEERRDTGDGDAGVLAGLSEEGGARGIDVRRGDTRTGV